MHMGSSQATAVDAILHCGYRMGYGTMMLRTGHVVNWELLGASIGEGRENETSNCGMNVRIC